MAKKTIATTITMSEPNSNKNDSDSDSFSSDSDDEFLTKDGKVDREALIRKKLLENFYGTTAPETESIDEDSDDDSVAPEQTDDLDAPHFSAAQHTAQHVWKQGVHPLLDLEEGLANKVRTLDSSLQTLVYENYSRFIDATDALKSIGTHVQAHKEPLEKLQNNMNSVSESSLLIEGSVSTLRNQVVEKIRVQRLVSLANTRQALNHCNAFKWSAPRLCKKN